MIGFSVEITGNATCNELGLVDIPILLSYSVTNGESWNDITLVHSGTDGNFSAVWMPSATGNYLVKAIWNGNSTYPGTSSIVNLAVLPFEEQTVFSVTSNSIISALSFDSESRELGFGVTGPSGTVGYVNVFIAKDLIMDTEDVEVKLNDEEVDFSVTSSDDSWLLHFTCLHSTHEVTIALGRPTTSFIETFPIEFVAFAVASIIAVVVVVFFALKRNQRSKEDKP